MKKRFLLIVFILISSVMSAHQFPDLSRMEHPRLLLSAGEEAKIKDNLAKSEDLRIIDSKIVENADRAIERGPLPFKMEGKRLLYVCMQYLQDMFAISYCYRMYGDQKYLEAGIRFLESACAFNTWNPKHFLDVGEMTLATSLAYDWLYDGLPESTRKAAREAIESKGINEALYGNYRGWYQRANNWNQVCNAGMIFGSIAIGDLIPEKANQILDNYYNSIGKPLASYEPDGIYPEGFMYWTYGTGLNCMLNFALEHIGVTPSGADGAFLKTGEFFMNLTAPTGLSFNYSDAGSLHLTEATLDLSLFYFAGKTKDKSLLWKDMQLIRKDLKPGEEISQRQLYNRLLPSALIYTRDLDMSDIPAPTRLSWYGDGQNPLYITRTSWEDPDAGYLGIKAGTARASHSHLDAGSFVYEANGVRWSMDPSNEEYFILENAGVDLWNTGQNSQRWDLLRYNNMHHSTMTLGGKKQAVDGKAVMEKIYDSKNHHGALVDMTTCYFDAEKVTRDIQMNDKKVLRITDEVCSKVDTDLQWTMMTFKDIEATIVSKHKIILKSGDKRLRMTVRGSRGFKLDAWPCKATKPYEDLDEKAVGFRADLAAGEIFRYRIKLVPLK